MKQVLQKESPCMRCGAPKVKKEYENVSDKTDLYQASYKTYTTNYCNKCGKKYAKLV